MSTTLTTNVISNVYNLGGTSACDAGTQTCSEGYSLYFPCLKDITRGQDVCFDFYVADSSTQDVVDLRDVDALTLELLGLYNCSYGTYSYPDYITSLQSEEYDLAYSNDFGSRTLCDLDVISIDKEMSDSDSDFKLNQKERTFYSGTEVELAAYDTDTHIFTGWAVITELDGECDNESWDDYIVSEDNVYRFIIENDITVYALYRSRKTYSITIDSTNRNSHFTVIYKNKKYQISNKKYEIFEDEYDHLDNILEGYHIIVECIPNVSIINEDSDDWYTYDFVKWIDGNTDRSRVMCVGTDTKIFESNGTIMLKAVCRGPVDYYEHKSSTIIYTDKFDDEGIHINTEFSDEYIGTYEGDEYTKYIYNVYQKYIKDEGFLYFNNGTLTISSFDIEDGIKLSIYAKSENEECDLTITINEEELVQTVSIDEFKQYDFYFRECAGSNIEININGKCLIDAIEVYEENINNKGKAEFCIDSDITSNLPSGTLSIGGAISVNGSTYGLSKTQIANINRLTKITIN